MRNAVSLSEKGEEEHITKRREPVVLSSILRRVDAVEELASSIKLLDPSMDSYPLEESISKIVSRRVMGKRKAYGKLSSVLLDFCIRIFLSVVAHKIIPSVLEELAREAKDVCEHIGIQ